MPGAPLHAHLSHQTVSFVDPNVFETANAGFAQAMYEEFLRDPAAVGPEWRRLFESGVVGRSRARTGRTDGQADRRNAGVRPVGRRATDASRPPGRRPAGRRRRTAGPAFPPAPARSRARPPSSSPTWSRASRVPTATTFRVLPVGGAGGAAAADQRRAPGRRARRTRSPSPTSSPSRWSRPPSSTPSWGTRS